MRTNDRLIVAFLATSMLALMPALTAAADDIVLPGSGGTAPADWVGTYDLGRADSPEHTVTITPFGMSSNLCRADDCVDGSINFSLIECHEAESCVFTSAQCVGSLTRLDTGAVLITASPYLPDWEALCRGFGGHALPSGAPPVRPRAGK